MARLAPPAVGTSIAVEGVEHEPLTGEVTIRAGVGVYPSVDGKTVQLDAQTSDPAGQINHYHPGQLPAVTAYEELARWANERALGGKRVATLLEAYARVAPVGVDAANYGDLRLRGSVSGEMALGITTTAKRHAIDNAQAVTQYGAENTGETKTGAKLMMGYGFVAQTSATVYGLRFRVIRNDGNPIPSGITKTAVIAKAVDGGWKELQRVSTTAELNGVAGPSTLHFPVGQPIEQGATYVMLFYVPAWWSIAADGTATYFPTESFSYYGAQNWGTGFSGGDPFGIGNANYNTHELVSANPDPLQWFPTTVTDPAPVGGVNQYNSPSDTYYPLGLLATPEGVAFDGDLILEARTVGAPTNTGEDWNLRVEIAPGDLT